MLKLLRVTLIAMTGKDEAGHVRAIEQSSKGIQWGAIKLIYDETIDSIDEWNKRIVYDLHKYVETDFAMLIHADGYVIRPDLWNPDWLNYDYIGAPWPLPQDDYSYRTPDGQLVRVGNSVSLRSKRLLQLPSDLGLEWKAYYGNTNEDGFLCVHHRKELESRGVVFAPLAVAAHFSKEHTIPENRFLDTFAFHSL